MDTRYFDINEDGYSVRCKIVTGDKERTHDRVVICTHGFGGNKDIANIQKFAEKFVGKDKHAAVIALDWPCHGKDARKKLELSECFEYLTLVVNYAKEQLSASRIYNYSVSFGAWLTLAYIQNFGSPFARIALRSTGIRMAELMLHNVSPDDQAKLAKGKEVEIGFERKMKIDQGLIDDLAANDVTQREFFDWADDMIMIHGTEDTYIPVDEARAFAEDNVIEFMPVEGSDHTFRAPKYMDQAIHAVVEFFA